MTAGFPGAWFVAPACFLFPVVGLLSVLLQLAIAEWPALAAAKGRPGAGPGGAAPDRGPGRDSQTEVRVPGVAECRAASTGCPFAHDAPGRG